ncbi:LysE family translocator [uncultured Kocuria sp.]|uniref:LysE family translocator n=1 Tax=uncultured Kocuria sp. TaxID=259305 RepID=UPI00262B743B|nr:LysE family translocator [uncultured Kocuria sp.]
MDTSSYLALLGVAVVLAVTPGPDTVLTLGCALRRRRAGMLAAAGAALGVLVWAGLVAVGVAAFLDSSPAAFQTLRLLGGAYLFYLGYRALTAHVPAPATAVPATVGAAPAADSTVAAVPARPEPSPATGRSAFAAGLACCLTNPKTGLFFLALLPQFTPPGAGTLFVVVVMGGTVAATIGIYLLIVALAAHTARTWLNRPTVTRRIELTSGAVFVVLGLVTTVPVLASWI